MSRDGFSGRALLGSCRAGTSPVPLPGHPVLSRVTPATGRVYHGAFPALSRGWDRVEDAVPANMGDREVGMLQLPTIPSICLIAQLVLAGIPAQRFAV